MLYKHFLNNYKLNLIISYIINDPVTKAHSLPGIAESPPAKKKGKKSAKSTKDEGMRDKPIAACAGTPVVQSKQPPSTAPASQKNEQTVLVSPAMPGITGGVVTAAVSQLPSTTSMTALPLTGNASNEPIAVVAAAAAAEAAKIAAVSAGMKPLPSSLSVHPILCSAAPGALPQTMSLTAIAAAGKPDIAGLQQDLSQGHRWPSHLNTLNTLAEISGHRLGVPSNQGQTTTPPPYAMPGARHPSIPTGLSVIRKQGPFQSPGLSVAPSLTLGGAGPPNTHYSGSAPPRLQGPHEHKQSSNAKSNSGLSKPSIDSQIGTVGLPLSLPNATITSLQSLTSNAGMPSPPKSGGNRTTAPSTPPHSTPPSTTTHSAKSHPSSSIATSLGSPYGHFAPEHYPGHPSFGGYPPRLHGPSSRHPPSLHPGQGGPLPPGMYGSPMAPHPGYPPHPGVLRGPHDLYRPSPPHPGHSSPNHPPAHLLMKGYPGMEPLGGGYPGSPSSRHQSPHHESQGPGSPSVGRDEERDVQLPAVIAKKAADSGAFSSGLLSYFSSQREDDIE